MPGDSPEILAHYLAVRDGRRPPRFVQASRVPVEFNADDGDNVLWQRHADAVNHLRRGSVESGAPNASSLLDLKIALADRMLDACDLCPHHCRVNRNRGERGFCGVADRAAVHWEGILHGEEIEVVPSHEVFLSGCTMRCAFCYSHEFITRPMRGLPIAPEQLAERTRCRRAEGATNLNLVGGEPIVHVAHILRTLRALGETPIPIVWNSNMYATPETMALLDGIVDLFLGDIHFGNPGCAQHLGRIPNYLPAVQAAFETAVASGASVIIRHLVMPGHLGCCARPAMEWAESALPNTPFHLMLQYIPDFRAENDPVLGRVLTVEEKRRAVEMAHEIGVRLYGSALTASEPNPRPRGLGHPLPCREGAGTRGVGGGDRPEAGGGVRAGGEAAHPIGDTLDILIHDDGRVSFTRLEGGLLPVAAALNHNDERITART